MHCADPSTGKHGNRGLDNHRHVDQHTVLGFDPISLQHIGKFADFTLQLAVGQGAFVTRLTLPDDRGLVATPFIDMAINTVNTYIGLAAHKPLCIGSFPVQHLAPLLIPAEFLCLAGPKNMRLFHRLLMHALVLRHAGYTSFLGKLLGGFKFAVFAEVAFDIFTHNRLI